MVVYVGPSGIGFTETPPKVGRTRAQHLQKAFILHTLWPRYDFEFRFADCG